MFSLFSGGRGKGKKEKLNEREAVHDAIELSVCIPLSRLLRETRLWVRSSSLPLSSSMFLYGRDLIHMLDADILGIVK